MGEKNRSRRALYIGATACAAVAVVGMVVNASTSNAYEPAVPPGSTHPLVSSEPTGPHTGPTESPVGPADRGTHTARRTTLSLPSPMAKTPNSGELPDGTWFVRIVSIDQRADGMIRLTVRPQQAHTCLGGKGTCFSPAAPEQTLQMRPDATTTMLAEGRAGIHRITAPGWAFAQVEGSSARTVGLGRTISHRVGDAVSSWDVPVAVATSTTPRSYAAVRVADGMVVHADSLPATVHAFE